MADSSFSSGKINVLLMGGGGREHALAIKLTQSPRMATLYTTHPQNPGLAALAQPVDVPVNIRESYRLLQFLDKHDVRLVVIGPEEPLAEGFADKLRSDTRLVFGPASDGAMLESDKAWSKQFMRGASIPTAEARIFSSAADALSYIKSRPQPPVIKAAGLAKGKGVIVPTTIGDAVEAIDRIMVAKVFGDAGKQVVVEERLQGPEVSVLALVDGRSVYVLETCQDHKRLLDNDKGPNTGGMGAFSPSREVDEEMMKKIERQVLVPTLDALRREDIDYRGVLYAGLMLTPGGPKVLEYNCRFGDPECQALMVRLKSDLVELIIATCQGRLSDVDVEWQPGASCCIVLAAPGYPEEPRAGLKITGLDAAAKVPGVTIHHAGTKRGPDGSIVTAGGRVLGVTGVGPTIEEARRVAYQAADLIQFEGKQMRRDIGIKG
jgi:phosphoribosylamine--glycine ligase